MARSAKIATDSRRSGQDDIEGRNLHRASIFRSILACAIPGDREPEVSTLKNTNDYVLPSRGAYFLRFVLGIFVEILSFFLFPLSLSLLWHCFLSIALVRIQKNYCRRKTRCPPSDDLSTRSWTCLESLPPYTSCKIFRLGFSNSKRCEMIVIYIYH